tara:strand:+ start:10247 stop:10573 length:327 start_codon:yes stop_codon:yes gene_type:complete
MKLVRDKIPEIIKKDGKSCSWHFASKEEKKDWKCSEYGYRLLEKMREELTEFEEDFSIEEFADIYEVFSAMLKNWNFKLSTVKLHARKKALKNGKFTKGIVLESVSDE